MLHVVDELTPSVRLDKQTMRAIIISLFCTALAQRENGGITANFPMN